MIWLVVGHRRRDRLGGQAPRRSSTARRWVARWSAISAPVYWLGLVSLYLFASDIGKFRIFPGAGSYVPFSQDPSKWFSSLILPWLVLAASFAAIYARLLRANLIEVMSEDYIGQRVRRASPSAASSCATGCARAITPIVTALGLDLGVLLGGAILTETVFNIPGIGRLAYDSILDGRPADDPGNRAARRVLHRDG